MGKPIIYTEEDMLRFAGMIFKSTAAIRYGSHNAISDLLKKYNLYNSKKSLIKSKEQFKHSFTLNELEEYRQKLGWQVIALDQEGVREELIKLKNSKEE